jgi:putative ABC transport system ATP-binding protein
MFNLRSEGSAAVAEPIAVDPSVAVSARDLWKTYGEGECGVIALAGIDIDVARGEFVAVMGPSGSGKSTLMHVLAGLDRADQGTVAIDGDDVTKMKDKDLTIMRRRRIGFIFQAFNLLPQLTAEENVTLPLSLAGEKPHQDWVDEVIGRVALSDRKTHKPTELSGGQQQRVAIARALVTKPAVVFADEPTGNLDSRSSDEVLLLLREASRKDGQTTVMVTHDPHAAGYADRVVFLADGKIVREIDNPTEAIVLEAIKEVSAR